MGSQSDWPTMKLAGEALDELDIEYEVISQHGNYLLIKEIK